MKDFYTITVQDKNTPEDITAVSHKDQGEQEAIDRFYRVLDAFEGMKYRIRLRGINGKVIKTRIAN